VVQTIASGARARPLLCAALVVVPVAGVLAASLALRAEYRATAQLSYRFPLADRDAVRLWGVRPLGVRSGFSLPDSLLSAVRIPSWGSVGRLELGLPPRPEAPATRRVTAVAGDAGQAQRRATGLAEAIVRGRGRAIERYAGRTRSRSPAGTRELALLAGIERANVFVSRPAGPALGSRNPVRNTTVALVIGLWLAAATALWLGRRGRRGEVHPGHAVAAE
jgi:hypothetical protein